MKNALARRPLYIRCARALDMRMKTNFLLAVALTWCAATSCFAQAEHIQPFGPTLGQLQLAQQGNRVAIALTSERPTIRSTLRGYAWSIERQCAKRAKAAGDANDGTTDVISELQQETVCACYPEKTRATVERLGRWKRDPQFSGKSRFGTVAVTVTGIVRPCAAEKLELLFEGESCPGFDATNSRGRTSQPSFCSCMNRELDAWTDAEMQDAGMELLQFNDSWRYAKASSTDVEPLIDRYRQTLAKCRGGSTTL
jgi:hypothetical protein